MNFNKQRLRKMLYIYLAILIVLIFSSRTIYNITLPKVTAAMPQSGRLTKELEVRGVVGFSETFDMYASSSGQIDEIFIKKGDLLYENTVIATYKSGSTNTNTNTVAMKFNIERINNQLNDLAINKATIQEKLRGLDADVIGDLYSYQWVVADAQLELERRQTELLEAQRFAATPFNDYTPLPATTETEREWNKKIADLKDAQNELISAETGHITFDDYAYQQAINETSIALERRKSELQNAEDTLSDARRNGSSSFDNYSYQSAINTARIAYDRSNEDYNNAIRQYENAVQDCNYLISIGADEGGIIAAQKAIDNAQASIISAQRMLEDASAAYEQAQNDMKRAENDFNTSNNDTRQKTVDEAEALVRQAELAVEDAKRAYENAVNELKRARTTFSADSEETRLKAVSDAQKKVELALAAIDVIILSAQRSVTDAEVNLANAQTALERAETNLEFMQKTQIDQMNDVKSSLNLDLRRTDLDIAGANIDLREIEASLASDTDTEYIKADCQGIIISVEKSRGQFVSQGEKIATVGINNNLFTTEIIVSDADGRFIEIGDEVSLYRSGSSSALKAVVYDIVPETIANIKVILIFETDDFKGGEYVTIKFQKQTEVYHALVPNEAIFSEGISNYVWVVRSRQGALGLEYFSVKVKVFITDTDDFYSAISRGLETIEPVVTSYDKDLMVNGRVGRMDN